MAEAERTPCKVPFCGRSKKGAWLWWLCPDHWRPVDRELKALRTRLKRRFRKRGEIQEGKTWWRTTSPRASRAIGGVDRRMIRQAIERAAGISA